MHPRVSLYVAIGLLMLSKSLHAVEDWTALKFGMTAEEALTALGDPLMKTSGGGFELWIYDNHAEALFYGGPLIAWTTPSHDNIPGKPSDVWQHPIGAVKSTVFVLPRRPLVAKRDQRLPVISRAQDEALPLYRIRN